MEVLWLGSDRLVQEVFDYVFASHKFHYARSLEDAEAMLHVRGCDLLLVDIGPRTRLQSSDVQRLSECENVGATVVMTSDYYPVFGGDKMKAILSGYLPKTVSPETFQTILHAIAAGKKKFFPREAWDTVLGNPNVCSLDEVEVAAVRLLALGCTASHIAPKLGISVSELNDKLKSVYSKLEVKNRVAAAVTAYESRIL